VLLDLLLIHGVSRDVLGVLVDVAAEDGLRVVWLDVFSRAALAVATCADFVVEGTVDFVCFCAVDGC